MCDDFVRFASGGISSGGISSGGISSGGISSGGISSGGISSGQRRSVVLPPVLLVAVLLTGLLTGLMSGLIMVTPLHAAPVFPGVHYDPITPSVPRSSDKPEVVEVFNFKCPHCYSLAPYVTAWLEKNREKYNYQALPVFWGKQTDIPLKAFYAAEFLGKGEEMKLAIFKAHFSNSADIENIEEITFLADSVGLDPNEFRDHMESFGVAAKISQGQKLKQMLGVNSTPTVVVNGAYQVSPGKHAKNEGDLVDYPQFFQIIESLATK